MDGDGCGHMSEEGLRRGVNEGGLMPSSRGLATTEEKNVFCHSKARLRRRRDGSSNKTAIACALLAASFQTVAAQSCISLKQSTVCPAFHAASISTDSAVTGLFPFLSTVSSVSTFDAGLQSYIEDGFAQCRYQQLLGCSNFNSDNTTAFYARYTASVLCNAIIQNSIQACGLTGNAARPLCAESCASYAESEEQITASNVCGKASSYALTQIRADFTNCALPANSLTGSCISAVDNQPDNCGFNTNMGSLCSYCAASSPNATDSCCVFSDTEKRCSGVSLPVVATSALQPITTSASSTSTSTSSTSTSTAGAAGHSSRGLTKGQIAGIVIGSVLGALLILACVIGACLFLRRRRENSPATSIFNQPTPMIQRPASSHHQDGARDQERAFTALPQAPPRVARMSALESTRKDTYRNSTTDEEDSPAYAVGAVGAGGPPKRSGSLSSHSHFAAFAADEQDTTSPSTNNNDTTSPESQGQSEQLAFFKDYYSQDEIHAGDLVATLWAYEPRAADEFQLDRGDMIKVIGIWDDGWATGVRVRQKAEDWRPDEKILRDSGHSNGSSSRSPATTDGGEVKAFPLVCVCLPQHWRKTIEGESTEGSGPPDIP